MKGNGFKRNERFIQPAMQDVSGIVKARLKVNHALLGPRFEWSHRLSEVFHTKLISLWKFNSFIKFVSKIEKLKRGLSAMFFERQKEYYLFRNLPPLSLVVDLTLNIRNPRSVNSL